MSLNSHVLVSHGLVCESVCTALMVALQVDGALQGEVTGFKRIYLDSVPHGECIHDKVHNFNLCIGFAYKKSKFFSKWLKHLRKSNVYINDSPKRLKAFHLIQRRGDLDENNPTKVDPSRWQLYLGCS